MTFDLAGIDGPHAGASVSTRGPEPADARAAVIVCHGRGAYADDILTLADAFALPDVAYIAPQAQGSAWYPNRFIAPLKSNEPHLASALAVIGAIASQLEQLGVPTDRLVVMGFSQGACLALEYAARNARRYGGVIAFSGGLIGPPGMQWSYPGSLAGTPVLLGCSDRDPHVPRERLEESARELLRIGAGVDLVIYPGLGHTINHDEIARARRILDGIPN